MSFDFIARMSARSIAVVGFAIVFFVALQSGVFALPDCTGLVEGNVDCAQAATCPTIDPVDGTGTCSGTEISVTLVDRCTSVGA